MHARTFALMVSICIFLFIIELIREQKMTFKYSVFWLCASGFTLVLAFNMQLLSQLSHLAGFELTSNFVFFLFLAFISLLCLFLTVYMNEQNSRTESLAQTVGILESQLRELKKKTDQGTTGSEP